MKTTSTIIFLFFSCLLAAQNPVTESLDRAKEAFEKGRFDTAERYYKHAHDLAGSSGTQDSLVFHSQLQLGRFYLITSAFDNARLWLDKALASSERFYGQDHITTLRVYAHITKVYNRLYDTTKSRFYAQKMLRIYLLHFAPEHVPENENDIFDTFLRLTDETDLLNQIPELQLGIGDNLVNLLQQLGRFDDAEKLLLKLQAIYRNRDEQGYLAANYSTLGQVSSMRYQHQQALTWQFKALRYFEKRDSTVTDKISRAIIWQRLGRNYTSLYINDSSLIYKNKALAVYESLFTIPNESIAVVYSSMAYDYLVLGYPEKSLESLDKALSAGISDKLTLLYNKGLYLENQLRWEEAALTYKSALQLSNNRYHINRANVLTSLAVLLNYDLDMSDSAQATIDEAIAVNTRRDKVPEIKTFNDFQSSPDPVSLLNSLIWKANLLANEPMKAADHSLVLQAIEVLDMAERLIAYLRLQFIIEEDNLSFSEMISGGVSAFVQAYTIAYDQTGNQHFLQKAFEYSDMNKSQTLLEALKSSTVLAGHENSLLNQWGALKKDMRYHETSLQNLKIQETPSPDEITAVQNKLQTSRDELGKLLKQITRENTNLVYYISDNIRKSKADRLQEYLKKNNSIALQYYINSLGVYQYLITEDSISYKSYAWGDTLEVAVDQVVNYIDANSVSDTLANQQFLDNANLIYNKLFEVLPQGQYQDKNLIIIPEGYLSRLPFEVLLTDHVKTQEGEIDFNALPYLIKERKISYAFSASVLMENISSKPARWGKKQPTAWAPYSDDSDLSEFEAETFRSKELDQLRGAASEIMPLADKFKGQVYMNEAATESNFKANAQESGILHIATHGIANHENPEMSYLVFANEEDQTNDGYLHLFEVYNMQINNELTILSACQSGDGSNFQGEGVISMARAFTYAGSKSVLMSLWLANDNSTSRIIENFYTHLENKKPKSEALQISKLAYLESANNVSAHPYYWAHLVVSGDGAPVLSSQSDRKFTWLIGFLLVGLCFAILKRNSARLSNSKV